MKLRTLTTTALFVTASGFPACATTQPPSELLQARQAYRDAQQSDAARYDPAAIHDAKTSLDKAEAKFTEEADSPITRDAAYVALRRAELAKVQGETASLQSRNSDAVAAARRAEAKSAQNAQQELTDTRSQLTQATAAREAAEQRARDAMMSLQLSKAASVAEAPQGIVITVPGGFLFRSEDAALMPAASDRLDKIVAAVKEQGNRKILIEGHTDSRGADAYNMNLSRQRADSVANYLTSHGIASEKVSAVGVGSSRPVASNETPEGRAMNRRVEITIDKTEPR
jgi:outer membrane protein OmpA-like peptidoglycan-associated protein